MQQEHTHDGEPTYLAYAGMTCRHPDCYAAFTEYRERLAERKLAGTFADMRRKENRPTQIVEQLRNDPVLAGQLIQVLAGTVEAVVDERDVQSEPPSEPAEPPAPPDARKPVAAITGRPLTLLDCLAELAGKDGGISLMDVTSHAKEFAARLGLEPLQFTAELQGLVARKQLGFGISMVGGQPVSVTRSGHAADGWRPDA